MMSPGLDLGRVDLAAGAASALPVSWVSYLAALVLVLIRISGLMVFAPVFSSQAIPARVKAVFCFLAALCVAPVVAGLPLAEAELGVRPILGEMAVGLVFGLSLSLLFEVLTFAGQLLGFAFSFSLVNLLDPYAPVQVPLMGQLFTLLGSLVVIGAGLDRTLLAALLRSFAAVPLGSFLLTGRTAMALVAMGSGIFLAALQLAAPVMAATLLVEFAVGLAARLSPQLPVLAVTVPAKTLLGFTVLIGSLALWPRFLEARFDGLLDAAELLLRRSAGA
jgi:flagellar biosynthesis protein FliR